MTIGIYCIENLVNGKKYVGKSINISKRLQTHKAMLRKEVCPTNCNRYLHAAVKKYGIDSFSFSPIEINNTIDSFSLSERELYWQDFYQVHDRRFGYNLVRESQNVITVSEETRKRQSAAQTGKKRSPEAIAASIAARVGYKHTEETKLKISASNTGKNHTEESRLKLSIFHTGRQMSEETKAKISKGNKNKVHKDRGSKQSPEVTARHTEKMSKYSYEQYTLEGEFVRTYARAKDLPQHGFVLPGVTSVCTGKSKTHKGFFWVRIPKIEIDMCAADSV